METVRAINVPMYTTLRSTAVAFTMIIFWRDRNIPCVFLAGIQLFDADLIDDKLLSCDSVQNFISL
jgi:hypothetical protein